MRIDAGLLKNILEGIAESGYPSYSLAVDEIKIDAAAIENVARDKFDFHVMHLIKEGYLAGEIISLAGGGSQLIFIERITDKGMLVLDAIESGPFRKWLEKQTGEAAETVWKSSAGVAWALLKGWLAEKGLILPGS